MNTNNSIAAVIASIRQASVEIKALAANARTAAPKGQKMVVGQHAASEAKQQIAAATIPAIVGAGWVASSITVNKAGTDIAVHYRAPVTLAQRVATWETAKAKRTAIREAKRAAKASKTETKTEAKPSTAPTTEAAQLSELASLIASMKKAA
jgi:hypothetical protein